MNRPRTLTLLAFVAASFACHATLADEQAADKLARGKYLVTVAGPWIAAANATNTAHSGPWGVSFTANLTPDPETGLGKWTLRNFMDTIRSGRHQGRGREVLPPMPIQVYKNFTDADLS